MTRGTADYTRAKHSSVRRGSPCFLLTASTAGAPKKSSSTVFVVSSSRLSLTSTWSPRTSITTAPSSVIHACRPRSVRQESAGGASSATFPSSPERLPLLIALGQRFRVDPRQTLPPSAAFAQRDTYSTPSGPDFISLRAARKIISTAPCRIHRLRFLAPCILLHQHVYIEFADRADVERVVLLEIFLEVEPLQRLDLSCPR